MEAFGNCKVCSQYKLLISPQTLYGLGDMWESGGSRSFAENKSELYTLWELFIWNPYCLVFVTISIYKWNLKGDTLITIHINSPHHSQDHRLTQKYYRTYIVEVQNFSSILWRKVSLKWIASEQTDRYRQKIKRVYINVDKVLLVHLITQYKNWKWDSLVSTNAQHPLFLCFSNRLNHLVIKLWTLLPIKS